MAEFDTGMGTTPSMWEMLSDELAEEPTKLPESLNAAIYALRDGKALVVPDESEYTRKFESRVFGATRDATKDETSRIEKLAADCPVAVFSALNRILNARGLCITIDAPEPPNG